jgi:hypothetical protein
MGFKVPRKAYKLRFQGEFDGLEVTARSLRLDQLLELEDARAERAAGDTSATHRMLEMLTEALVDWNAEDEDTGEPIPRTIEGVKSQDPDFYMAVLDAWHTAMVKVPDPLPETSNDGVPSLEASIPMDVPSESLAS